MSISSSNQQRLLAFAAQVGKFGAVGLVGFAVDVSVFNVLRATVFDPHLVHAGPLYAKIVSTVLAILANWVGNRYWTFSSNRQSRTTREAAEFFAVSLAGMAIGLLCLWVSHYMLGQTSVLADNISSNVVGLGLGAVFRFVLYRYWVFAPARQVAAVARQSARAGRRPAPTGAERHIVATHLHAAADTADSTGSIPVQG